MDSAFLSLESPRFLKLLAHDLRWKMLTALSRGDYRVHELVSLVAEPQNLVSYHLKQLRDLHLVSERRSNADARDIYYSLDLEQLRRFYFAAGAALHPALNSQSTQEDPGELSANGVTRVLFLCTENSARSQMAEGILRHLGGRHVQVSSAGNLPSAVHPYAIRVLAESSIDISQQHAKHLDEFEGQHFDYVVTVCDRVRENCPTFPGDTKRIHWSLPDPVAVVGEEAQYQAFKRTARQLETRMRFFVSLISHQKENVI